MKTVFLVMCSLIATPLFSQTDTAQKLDGLMNGYFNAGRFNGSVLVARQGKILLQKGYGVRNAEQDLNNDAHTIYQLASITKTFTAAVILKLVEQNKLHLNDKLSKFYKDFPNSDQITITQLMHHTSGIHNLTETDTMIAGSREKPVINFLKTLPPDFAPGTSMHYSNSGYIILGYIIQKATGLTYWQAVRKYLFEPLQMNQSGFDFTRLTDTNKSIGYEVLKEGEARPIDMLDSTVAFAAGAIYSTVGDLFKWHLALQNHTLLSKATTEMAYQPSSQNNYGFGWQIDSIFGRKMVSHSGGIRGFGTNFARIPADDICIVLLSNKNGATFETFNITNSLLALLYGKPYEVPSKRQVITLREDELKPYVGVYEVTDPPLVIDMNIEEGRLIARPHNGPPSQMLPLDKNRFYAENDEALEIVFEKDQSGKVFQMIIHHRERTRPAKKIK